MAIDSTPVEATQSTDTSAIDELVSRVGALYSLPAVASEVIRLTDNPKVDVRALKDCIERDPALTVKLLKVVNSSLFGLSREVSDLNQALALLGIKPLKLLVLGFSLPEGLFAEVAREQLNWYWRTTLTRAVAAREISEQLFGRPGDEPFLAGLLQDIGVLVLLGQFRDSYANFLDHTFDDGFDLAQTEFDALGFDHLQLSGRLLDTWNMPRGLVDAVAAVSDGPVSAIDESQSGHIKRVLQLAHLLTELVGNNRLSVLPDLLQLGAKYCNLDKPRLNELVTCVQPKVQQLAEVLRVELTEATDYAEILIEAHRRMSLIAESVAEPLSRECNASGEVAESLLEETQELQQAVNKFLNSSPTAYSPASNERVSTADEDVAPPFQNSKVAKISFAASFKQRLTLIVGHCRSQRQPLSVLLFQITEVVGTEGSHARLLGRLLISTCEEESWEGKEIEFGQACSHTLVLPNCDRREAIEYAQVVVRNIERALQGLARRGTEVEAITAVGIASVALPPKNFEPLRLVQTAERCLEAAQKSGTSLVKSLEIY